MTGVVQAVRRALVRADDALLAARDSLTPGQRWTCALLAAVTLALLVAGAPTRTIVRPGQPAAAASPAPARSGPAPVAPALEGPGPLPVATVPPLAPAGQPAEPAPADPPAGEEPPPTGEPEPAPPPEDEDEGEGDDGEAPPCPDGIPLVVAEAGLCREP